MAVSPKNISAMMREREKASGYVRGKPEHGGRASDIVASSRHATPSAKFKPGDHVKNKRGQSAVVMSISGTHATVKYNGASFTELEPFANLRKA